MKTVLIIDDSKDYQELLKMKLTKEGYYVLTAENGKDAVSLVKKNAVDFIFLDLSMPEVDGVSFYYQLEHVIKKHIPIIVLTNAVDATGVGDDIEEIIVKADVSLADLAKKVKRYIG